MRKAKPKTSKVAAKKVASKRSCKGGRCPEVSRSIASRPSSPARFLSRQVHARGGCFCSLRANKDAPPHAGRDRDGLRQLLRPRRWIWSQRAPIGSDFFHRTLSGPCEPVFSARGKVARSLLACLRAAETSYVTSVFSLPARLTLAGWMTATFAC